MSGIALGQFFWMVGGQEVAGPAVSKPTITADDAKMYPLPDNATSGVLRVQGGEEWPCPARDLLALTDEQLRSDESKRRELIAWLRAKAFWAMVGAGVAADVALGRGQQFVGRYARELYGYVLGSAPDFRAAMVSAPEPWLETEVAAGQTIRQLFLESIPAGSVTVTAPNFISVAQRDELLSRVSAATTVAATKAILADLIELLCPG